MNRAVTRLIGTVIPVVLSAGISMGGITYTDSRKALVPRGAIGANGIQELLDFIYQCRDCDRDREARGDNSGFAFGGGGMYQSLLLDLSSAAVATQQIWLATNPVTAGGSTANSGAGGPAAREWSQAEPTQTIAYLGGVSDSFVSSAGEAFRGRNGNHGRGRGYQGFGHNPDTLAAVPEPAPIFLLGTILLATFSIARLRFNR